MFQKTETEKDDTLSLSEEEKPNIENKVEISV